MIDILKHYDGIPTKLCPENHSLQKELSNENDSSKSQIKKPLRRYIQTPGFGFTKTDRYKAIAQTDKTFIQDGRSIKHSDIGKLEKLKEYQDCLKNELLIARCPPNGPDLKRIQIYSAIFERLIEDFTTHGELLAEIKVIH